MASCSVPVLATVVVFEAVASVVVPSAVSHSKHPILLMFLRIYLKIYLIEI
jgi:hypothetical protein